MALQSTGARLCATLTEKSADGRLDPFRNEGLDPVGERRLKNRRLATAAKMAPRPGDLEGQIREVESRVRNLTQALARAGWSDAIGEQLRDEEDRLRGLRARQSAAPSQLRQAKLAVHLQAIQGLPSKSLGSLSADPERARAVLAKHLGPVTLTPKAEGLQPPLPGNRSLQSFRPLGR
jgi:TolA-binding protein